MSNREHVQHLAKAAIDAGDPTSWFETLYAEAGTDSSLIPWADNQANRNLTGWIDQKVALPGLNTLVVGCGLGADAEWLATQGAIVTAFDISPSAIAWAKQRDQSMVHYCVADMFDAPAQWQKQFDLIVEIYTLQALPLELRATAMPVIASWLAPGGKLSIITRGRDDEEAVTDLPWPLSPQELQGFEHAGLTCLERDDYTDPDEGLRRLRYLYEQAI